MKRRPTPQPIAASAPAPARAPVLATSSTGLVAAMPRRDLTAPVRPPPSALGHGHGLSRSSSKTSGV